LRRTGKTKVRSDKNIPWRSAEPGDDAPEYTLSESSHTSKDLSYCSRCGRVCEKGQSRCTECEYYAVNPPETPVITASVVEDRYSSNDSAGRSTPRLGGVPWGGWQIAAGIILVVTSLFLYLAAGIPSLLGSLYPEHEKALATWINVHVTAMAIVATVWGLGLRHSRYPFVVLGITRVQLPRKRTVFLTLGVLGVSLIATSVYSGIVDYLGLDKMSVPEVEYHYFEGPAVVLTFQALAFITPMGEELFFRGFIFRGLLTPLGPWGAIAASALVFSVFHLSIGIGVLIPIFITGCLFAWLYWRTGSLWATIGAHAGQNALALGERALGG